MTRPALGPDDRLIRVGKAADMLGVTVAAVRARCDRANPTIRGLPPRSEHNPTREWLVSADDIDAALRPTGAGTPPPPPAQPAPEALSLGDSTVQIEMLQGALRDAQEARLAQADEIIAELRNRISEKDRRIAELEHQLAAVASAFTRPLTPQPA